MAEYRIVAKVDPQTAPGTAKVKQDLKGVQSEAKATEDALARTFDHARFEKSIGGLISRIDQLDKNLSGLQSTNSTLVRSNETLGQSLDRVAASMAKTGNETKGVGNNSDDAAGKQMRLEAALRRVLQATDAEAAEQQRLNALLADAKKLLDAGMISQEQYAKAQKIAAQTTDELNAKTGAQKIGMQQLGFQLGDIATMYSLGAKPAQIFASQIGQVTQAVQLMAGGTSKFATFMNGPWGIAITVGTIILAPFVAKLFEGNDALDEAIDKMKKDAAETEINRRAKEAFAKTLEGQIALQRELNEELEKGVQSQRQQQQAQLTNAQKSLDSLRKSRAQTADDLTKAEKRLADLDKELKNPSLLAAGSEGYMQGLLLALGKAQDEVDTLKKKLSDADTSITKAQRSIRAARVPLQEDEAKAAADPIAAINRQYDIMRDRAVSAALGNEQLSRALGGTLANLEKQRKAAVDAAQAQERLGKSTGVATFRSREQAIGIAGREFQRAGFKVSENEQFGGVKGEHPGMGSAHGKYAVDINSGSGITEANVPEIKAQFDAAAKRYQSRGYRVLWNGWVYEANGDGPTRRIPAGQNQHRDHMHLEAPGTIVGKATQASTESEFQQDANQARRTEEAAGDFVQAIVTKAASRGLPGNNKDQLQADIDEAFADFERRFNRAATEAEKWKIRTALTEADARETARHFEDAYIKPLERLEALQGKTGIDRAVLNAQIEESLRLGRELTPVEKEQIDRGIRHSDQLERQKAILEAVRAPLEEYRAQIEALNALLAKGEISQTSYNARIAELAQSAGQSMSGISGVDPNTGKTYEDLGKETDENARYAKQLEDLQNHREQLLQMGIDYDALVEAAAQEHANRLAQIDQARKDMQLSNAQDIFGSLTSIAETMAGKQSAIYKAMFAAEKAVAIARSIMAIQTGIAQASALPFPANLGAIASVVAATASIVSNIRAVTLNFKDGGYINGPGGPRSDSVPINASNGEFIVNARDTAKNRALLEAINSGKTIRESGQATLVAAQQAAQPGAMPAIPAPNVNIRSINVLDPNLVGDFFNTPEGERVFVNQIRNHAESLQRIIGGS